MIQRKLCLWLAVGLVICKAQEASKGNEEEPEEPPKVVRVSRIEYKGEKYLLNKEDGIVYANSVEEPEEVGHWNEFDGVTLFSEEEEAKKKAKEHESESGSCGASSEFDFNKKEEESEGGCGCGSLSRGGDGEGTELESKYLGRGGLGADMVLIEGGDFQLGSEEGFFPEDDEGQVRDLQMSSFKIGKYTISNKHFEAFVNATGYVTEAERFNFSYVVEQFVSRDISTGIKTAVAAAPWWIPVNGSDWRHPEGPDTDIYTTRGDRSQHPAVHVSYHDARAFCRWAVEGGRLPTEAEWEYAAHGGLDSNNRFPWGNEFYKDGKKHRMNTWQSTIHDKFLQDKNVFKHSFLPTHDGHAFYSANNSAEDGFETTAPVDSFEPNAFGLYNLVGNVWEWTSDWRIPDRTILSSKNPKSDGYGNMKVKKGGSFMCHEFTCYRYRIAARMAITPDSSAQNIGFRCAASVETDKIDN
eukprot:m.149474 g.149474  ORF g.149474 m.149474 type:complete len:469 (+) comp15012_c0_seq5:94-1500(+)